MIDEFGTVGGKELTGKPIYSENIHPSTVVSTRTGPDLGWRRKADFCAVYTRMFNY